MSCECQFSDSLLVPGGHSILQFFKPVQHHVDLRRGGLLLIGLDHQEALAEPLQPDPLGGQLKGVVVLACTNFPAASATSGLKKR